MAILFRNLLAFILAFGRISFTCKRESKEILIFHMQDDADINT